MNRTRFFVSATAARGKLLSRQANSRAVLCPVDAAREWAYDRISPVGKLDQAWNEAVAKGWTVVGMKEDWNTIFPPKP